MSPWRSLTGFKDSATVAANAAVHMIPTFETGADSYPVSVSSGMDQADLDIIQVLQIDGRMPYGQIGYRVGLTEATVRRRVGRLIQEETISVVPVLNLSKVGYQVTALIGLETVPVRSEDVAEVVSEFEEVQVVVVTTGLYDVFLWTGFQSAQDLHGFMTDKLAAVDGVVRRELH